MRGGAPYGAAWKAYCDAVRASRHAPPYHLVAPLRIAEDAAARRGGRDKVNILDQGCGGGGTLLYLLASGFENIYGVDLSGDFRPWNRLLREEFGVREDRFAAYDGRRLPFPDGMFDVVLSEEVVEHVSDAAISDYYAEGARVLRPDGVAYFTVPHRLGPYDSHTQTWFVHYLPRSLALRYWRQPHLNDYLFLRGPGHHSRKLRENYKVWQDITRDRLMALTELDYYDGPRRLRLFLRSAAAVPGVGPLVQRIVSALLMRQTLSRKTPGPLPAIYR